MLAFFKRLDLIKPKRHTHWLDFHPGGVPAGIIFDMQVKDACGLAEMRPIEKDDLRRGVGAEFALIGLVAYFEGFCKNHAATILNVCPQLARELAERGRDIRLRAVDLLDYAHDVSTVFGLLVVENIDFGTAKSINSFYGDLLRITPLSKREAVQFHFLLEDRNLIVHHGNILTPNYSRERFIRREVERARIFMDSLEVTPKDARAAGQFLHALSIKMRKASRAALEAFVKKNRVRLPKPNREAASNLDASDPSVVWNDLT
jgi:hypothetical protein